MDMFEIIESFIDNSAMRTTETTLPTSRPRLGCHWVHDPVDNTLVCRWTVEKAAQDEIEDDSFAVAA
jgi:hypothetical protein